MKSELEKLMVGYEYPVSMIFEKRRTRNKKFNKNQFTLLEWCVVMHIQFNGKEFYHSYQSIAGTTDISKGTVQTALKELKEKGYISMRNDNMGNTKNECTHIKLNPHAIVRDLETIYDKEVFTFGYPKTKMYPSIEKYYKRLAEVSKEEIAVSSKKENIDWNAVNEELERIKEQQLSEIVISIEEEETELSEPPEMDYIEPGQEEAENMMAEILYQKEMNRQRIFFNNYMAGIYFFLSVKRRVDRKGICRKYAQRRFKT